MLSKKFCKFIAIIITLSISTYPFKSSADEVHFNSWNKACEMARNSALEGDLIFTDIPFFVFRQIAATTNSWTSHVGIIFKNDSGDWVVRESKVPKSQETPLCDFMKRSAPYLFEIKRYKLGITPGEISHMKKYSTHLMNQFYDLGFNLNSNKLFCSKFTFLVYKSVGIEVGRIESFQDLFYSNSNTQLQFWKMWFFGSIPWKRQTVTPASQLEDENFETILKGAPVETGARQF